VARKTNPKATGQRPLRVGEEIRHALATVVDRGELRDPELAGVALTFTEVRMSPDIRTATVFVTPLGGDKADEVAAALQRAASYLRRRVAELVQLRYAPDLRFRPDTSFDYAERIGAVIAEVTGDEDKE
jgi:ribosome-binding factor A